MFDRNEMQRTRPNSDVDKQYSRRHGNDESRNECNYWNYFEKINLMLTLETSNVPLMDSTIALESAGSDISALVNDFLLPCLNFNNSYRLFDLFN